MKDHATPDRQAFIAGGSAHKLAEAKRYLRARGLYCLDKGSRAYTPVYGRGKPLPCAAVTA